MQRKVKGRSSGMEKLENSWSEALKLIEKELTPASYNTWVEPLVPIKADNGIFYLSTDNEAAKLILEKRYSTIIEQKLSIVYGKQFTLSIIFDEDVATLNGHNNEFPHDVPQLNPRYSFDTFVIGSNNRLAHAASLAVAEAPSRAYNPLFLSGGAGLGKTHLMHAIGQFINRSNPGMRVLYISSEMFTNELIKAIKDRTNHQFRSKYRDIDVLLIDDIQFIEKKEGTQEEIFHTFNTLYEANKQIIISSDRHPKDLSTLSVRLRSRFEWGLVADIQPPDYENRVAILRNNASRDGYELNDGMLDVINLIAEKIHSNVRELEGAFNRVIAHSTLLQLKIDRDLVKEVLKDVFSSKENQPAPESIKKHVCKHFNIKIADIESTKRSRNFSYPRQVAMFLCRRMTDLSLPKIGENFGNRDHTTVLHACEKINEEISSSEEVKHMISSLEEEIRNM
jgi:chromosomal replication initiator protein